MPTFSISLGENLFKTFPRDGLSKVVAWNRPFGESLTIRDKNELIKLTPVSGGSSFFLRIGDGDRLTATTDALVKLFGKSMTEAMTLASGRRVSVGKRLTSEAILPVDHLVIRRDLGQVVGDLLTLVSAVSSSRGWHRILGDSATEHDALTKRVNWNRLFQELAENPDGIIAVRDAWNVIKHTIVPEIYRIPNFAQIFNFLEIFGNEYNRFIGLIDALPRLSSIRTAPAALVPELLKLIHRSFDPNKPLAGQYDELERSVDIYKRVGITQLISRRILIRFSVDSEITFPDLEVLRWSDQGAWSSDAVWGDKLQYNHHIARLVTASFIPGLRVELNNVLPVGIELLQSTGDVIVPEVPYGQTQSIDCEESGQWRLGLGENVISSETLILKQVPPAGGASFNIKLGDHDRPSGGVTHS